MYSISDLNANFTTLKMISNVTKSCVSNLQFIWPSLIDYIGSPPGEVVTLLFGYISMCGSVMRRNRCRFQRITEHKHSVIGKHLRDVQNLKNKDLRDQFTILKKCRRRLDLFNL